MPPFQLRKRFVSCSETVARMDGAGMTLMVMVAVLDKLPGSIALTMKLFVPSSPDTGVPENAPLGATLSHEGPLSFAKMILSPFGSVAFVAIVPEYVCPALALGSAKG